MATGRIECYLDISSIYSYIAFVDLVNNLDKLTAHGVEVDFRPVFLGAIMQRSGNRPPWMVKAKAAYLAADTARATAAVGIVDWATPPRLLDVAKTPSPLRALLFIKAHHGPASLRAALRTLFARFWAPPHRFLGDDAVLEAALADVPRPDDGGRRLFSPDDVRRIMDGRAGFKDALEADTARALDLGAFGAPWLWVTNATGRAEAFFGSDRFADVYRHLDIAHHDVELLAPPASRL